MQRIFMVLVVLVGVGLVGCGGPGKSAAEKEPEVELPHNHYAETRQGIVGADGTKTSLLEDPDYEALGLKVFPGAEPGRDTAAYFSEGETTKTTQYVLYSEKSVEEVSTFYEEALNSAPSKAEADMVLISGTASDGKKAVVTILGLGDGSTEISVQIYEAVG